MYFKKLLTFHLVSMVIANDICQRYKQDVYSLQAENTKLSQELSQCKNRSDFVDDLQNISLLESRLKNLEDQMSAMLTKNPNTKLCLQSSSVKLFKNHVAATGFTLFPSWRISFLFKKLSHTKGPGNIFRFTELIKDHSAKRLPNLRIEGNDGSYYLYGTPCGLKPGNWENGWYYLYHNPTPLNVEAAITIEYIRQLNQVKFYVNGVELNSHDYFHANNYNNCFGVPARLFLSDNHEAPIDGTVRYFEYEENNTGKSLGGLTVSEVLYNSCHEG